LLIVVFTVKQVIFFAFHCINVAVAWCLVSGVWCLAFVIESSCGGVIIVAGTYILFMNGDNRTV